MPAMFNPSRVRLLLVRDEKVSDAMVVSKGRGERDHIISRLLSGRGELIMYYKGSEPFTAATNVLLKLQIH